MGITNLKFTLTKRYATLSGVVLRLERQIEQAERAYRTIPEMRAEIARKRDELVHIAAVLQGVDPGWDPATVQPKRSHQHRLPLPKGECTRMAFEVLSRGGWMTIQEIVLTLFQQNAVEHDPEIYQLAASNIGQGFRRRLKLGDAIERDNSHPQRWRIKKKVKSE